jgi:hypothetical protein
VHANIHDHENELHVTYNATQSGWSSTTPAYARPAWTKLQFEYIASGGARPALSVGKALDLDPDRILRSPAELTRG